MAATKPSFSLGWPISLPRCWRRSPVLALNGASWSFTGRGVGWSLLAGTVGAAGAFGVLLAFGAKGTPAVVMSIIFAGAPVVNALYGLALHPPAGGWQKLPWQFVAGIVLAAMGGCLVSLYKPAPAPAMNRSAIVQPAQAAGNAASRQ